MGIEIIGGGLNLGPRRGGLRFLNNVGITNVQRVFALAPIAYWPLNEPVGTTGAGSVLDASGHSLTGTPTNITFGAAGSGDGLTAATFGVGSLINVYSAGLNTAFNGAVGSVIVLAKVLNSGVWTDGLIHTLINIRVDGNNLVIIRKTATNNNLNFIQIAGGTPKQVTKTDASSTGWMYLALTWSKAANQLIAYYNKAQQGTTQTGLGTWTGALAAAGNCIGSADTSATTPWSGYEAHVALFDRVLSPTEIAGLFPNL